MNLRGTGSSAAAVQAIKDRAAGPGKYLHSAKFLGGLEGRVGALEPEVLARRQAAIGAYQAFSRFWKARDIPFPWKCMVFHAIVISGSLLNGLAARTIDACAALLDTLEATQSQLARWLCRAALSSIADQKGLSREEVYHLLSLYSVRTALRTQRVRFFASMLASPKLHAQALEAISCSLPALGGTVWTGGAAPGDLGQLGLTKVAPPFLRAVCADLRDLGCRFIAKSAEWVEFAVVTGQLPSHDLNAMFSDWESRNASEAEGSSACSTSARLMRQCDICQAEGVTVWKVNLGAHKFRAHGITTVAHVVTEPCCPRCKKRFTTVECARVHYDRGGKPGTCPLPGEAGFREAPEWD